MLDLIEKTASFVEKVQARFTKEAAAKADYQKLIPGTVDKLVSSGMVFEANRVKLAEQLKDPRQALNCLAVMATKAASRAADTMGSTSGISYGTVEDREVSHGRVGSIWDQFAKGNKTWSL